jgi:hypothetical protein
MADAEKATMPEWCEVALKRYGHKLADMQPYSNRWSFDYPDRVAHVHHEAFPPAPAVGQVWAVKCDDGRIVEEMITAIERAPGKDEKYRLGDDDAAYVWPPPHSILVNGPGAPWIPRRSK